MSFESINFLGYIAVIVSNYLFIVWSCWKRHKLADLNVQMTKSRRGMNVINDLNIRLSNARTLAKLHFHLRISKCAPLHTRECVHSRTCTRTNARTCALRHSQVRALAHSQIRASMHLRTRTFTRACTRALALPMCQAVSPNALGMAFA